jgi:hypothetical protein
MLALRFLQEGQNTDLSLLLYALLGFLVVVIVVGALASRQKNEAATKSGQEAGEASVKPKTSSKGKKSPSRKKSR